MRAVVSALVGVSALIAGCAHTDVVLRPERTTFIQSQEKDFAVLVDQTRTVSLRCLDWDGARDTGTTGKQCLYFAADEQPIAETFAVLKPEQLVATRNLYTSLLLNLSDKNCSTFLGRSFANKASFDATKNLTQDVLTGSSAAAATLSAPTAATLSVFNLMVGKGVDNVNGAFFYEKTFQALETAIRAEREVIRSDIQDMKTKSYEDAPIYDVLAAVRRYDDACSIRVGLSKLQDLAQETKEAKAALAKNQDTIRGLQQQVAALDKELTNLKQAASSDSTAIAAIGNDPQPGSLLPSPSRSSLAKQRDSKVRVSAPPKHAPQLQRTRNANTTAGEPIQTISAAVTAPREH